MGLSEVDLVMSTSKSYEEMKSRLDACSQTHLLRFWDELTEERRRLYVQHLDSINLEEVRELFEKAMNALNDDVKKLDELMEPLPRSLCESEEGCSPEVLDGYRRRGLEEIAAGRVAVLLMAGGQGTRLGVDYPKGMYSVGLPSNKTLFQLQAERIRRVQTLAGGGRIVWYIMTSGPTNERTRDFLEKHDYFGLDPDDVVLFEQGLLPCFDLDGRIILEDRDRVALAPDGNGGVYRALARHAVLEDMRRRGVRYVHAHSVDNILVRVADPVFLGYCVEREAECGAKVVPKAGPSEAVGVVCQVEGRFRVVEYSEITDRTAGLRDAQGELLFSAGNICNHFFTVEFLESIATRHERNLRLHVAKKKIPHVDASGARVKPCEPNGIKIEKFVFDVFAFANKFVTWEVSRGAEFSALKNADEAGRDCPATARRDLLALHKRYVEGAGGLVLGEEVEVSPLLSYAGEGLESVVAGRTIESPAHLTAPEEPQSD